jgi:hypothetical protein
MRSKLHIIAACFGALLLYVASSACSDDDGPKPYDGSPPGGDAIIGPGGDATLPWPDAKIYLDTKPMACSPTDPNACNGAYTHFCDNNVCTKCPEYAYNCDHVGGCECIGACDGTSCVGTKKCSFNDTNVCGGDQTKWCENESCVDCPTDKFNCDKTKDCECTGGCKGSKCQ